MLLALYSLANVHTKVSNDSIEENCSLQDYQSFDCTVWVIYFEIALIEIPS